MQGDPGHFEDARIGEAFQQGKSLKNGGRPWGRPPSGLLRSGSDTARRRWDRVRELQAACGEFFAERCNTASMRGGRRMSLLAGKSPIIYPGKPLGPSHSRTTTPYSTAHPYGRGRISPALSRLAGLARPRQQAHLRGDRSKRSSTSSATGRRLSSGP